MTYTTIMKYTCLPWKSLFLLRLKLNRIMLRACECTYLCVCKHGVFMCACMV